MTLRPSPAIDFIFPELQGLGIVPCLPEVAGIAVPGDFEASVGISEVVAGLLQAAVLPDVLEPRILADQVLAGAEHREESAPKGLFQHIAPFRFPPVVRRGRAAVGSFGKEQEWFFHLSQVQEI